MSEQNGADFEHVPEELKADETIVSKAVQQDGAGYPFDPIEDAAEVIAAVNLSEKEKAEGKEKKNGIWGLLAVRALEDVRDYIESEPSNERRNDIYAEIGVGFFAAPKGSGTMARFKGGKSTINGLIMEQYRIAFEETVAAAQEQKGLAAVHTLKEAKTYLEQAVAPHKKNPGKNVNRALTRLGFPEGTAGFIQLIKDKYIEDAQIHVEEARKAETPLGSANRLGMALDSLADADFDGEKLFDMNKAETYQSFGIANRAEFMQLRSSKYLAQAKLDVEGDDLYGAKFHLRDAGLNVETDGSYKNIGFNSKKAFDSAVTQQNKKQDALFAAADQKQPSRWKLGFAS